MRPDDRSSSHGPPEGTIIRKHEARLKRASLQSIDLVRTDYVELRDDAQSDHFCA
jgi:hypothetical protein